MKIPRNPHGHLCPVCKRAFNCLGVRCSEFNGVPHLKCMPMNKFAKMTREVVHVAGAGYCDK
jgi:hypothetical protein